ncbi:gas2 domain containing protein [Stylonychia lemnae]|uniref:Gas2 domain containing protein n=1 Tax=Stylonychia lemnae TaxID=5949 RepID=A0A078A7C1_STYLE|nr:gas2 domain containing protein [Stylonychia lemnae]|eukprot:CDW76691.1 gas2 domain containing protein [Stylonychia lemnae]
MQSSVQGAQNFDTTSKNSNTQSSKNANYLQQLSQPINLNNSNTLKKNQTYQQSPVKQAGKQVNGKSAQSSNQSNDLQTVMRQIKEYEFEIINYKATTKSYENADLIIENLKRDIEQLNKRIIISEQARVDLQEQLAQSGKSENLSNEREVKYNSLLIQENQELRNIINAKDVQLREKDQEIDYLRRLLSENELEKQEMKVVVEETLAKYTMEESSVFESETKRTLLQIEYERSLDEYNGKLREQYDIIDSLRKEMDKLYQKAKDLENENKQKDLKYNLLESDLKKEQDKTKKMNELEKILADIKSQRDMLLKQIEQLKKEKDAINKKFEEMREELERLTIKIREEYLRYKETLEDLNRALAEKDEQLAKQDNLIKNLTQKQLDQDKQMLKLQRSQDAYDDLKKQNQDLQDQINQLKNYKEDLEQNMLMSNKLLEDKTYGQTDLLQRIRELMNELQATKAENDSMKKQLASLRASQEIYIPDKQDATDVELAKYINDYPDRNKLRIMFMKESEGVYQFGSRRVYVKVERDKIQGGGFLSIEEFIDIYTPMELDRVDRNDPLKRFSEKVAVQKTLALNSPTRSPERTKSQGRQLQTQFGNGQVNISNQNNGGRPRLISPK